MAWRTPWGERPPLALSSTGPRMVAVQNYHGNPAPPGKPVLTFQTGDVIELLRGDPESPWWEVGPGAWKGESFPSRYMGQRPQVPCPQAGRVRGESFWGRGVGCQFPPGRELRGPACPLRCLRSRVRKYSTPSWRRPCSLCPGPRPSPFCLRQSCRLPGLSLGQAEPYPLLGHPASGWCCCGVSRHRTCGVAP